MPDSQDERPAIQLTASASIRERLADNQPVWDAANKLAAPIAVMVSATCYLSGYMYRYVLLKNFGLRPGIIDSTVQDNIAFGYLPFAMLVVGGAGLAGFLFVVQWIAKFFWKNRIREAAKKSSFFITSPLSYFSIMQSSAILLTAGIFLGATAGFVSAERTKARLANDCRYGCHRYTLKTGHMTGVILATSKESTILAGRTTTYVLPTASLLSISDARPGPSGTAAVRAPHPAVVERRRSSPAK